MQIVPDYYTRIGLSLHIYVLNMSWKKLLSWAQVDNSSFYGTVVVMTDDDFGAILFHFHHRPSVVTRSVAWVSMAWLLSEVN